MSYRARRRAVDAFLNWAQTRGTMPRGDEAAQLWRERIEIMLQAREVYLHRPDPTRWNSGDVHQLLIDYVPRRQVDLWNLAEYAAMTVREYLRFLDDTDRLHPASTRVATLLKELDRLVPKFPAAMADKSRWFLAKRVLTAMAADGIRYDSDDREIDAWAERLSALDPVGRRQVLGNLMGQHPGYATGRILIHGGKVAVLAPGNSANKCEIWPDAACDCCVEDRPAYPAVNLPELPTLAAEVAEYGSGLLRELAALAAWVGPRGRPVDRTGELSKQDVADAAA